MEEMNWHPKLEIVNVREQCQVQTSSIIRSGVSFFFQNSLGGCFLNAASVPKFQQIRLKTAHIRADGILLNRN